MSIGDFDYPFTEDPDRSTTATLLWIFYTVRPQRSEREIGLRAKERAASERARRERKSAPRAKRARTSALEAAAQSTAECERAPSAKERAASEASANERTRGGCAKHGRVRKSAHGTTSFCLEQYLLPPAPPSLARILLHPLLILPPFPLRLLSPRSLAPARA